MLAPWKKSYDQPRRYIKKQRHYFAIKGPSSQSYGFSNSHVWMWELNYKESWALKNWCFRTVVLEKTLESSLDCKEIQPVHSKGDQSWIFIGRTDAKAETPVLWPPDAKNGLIGKEPDAGKDWRQEEKGTTEDETVAWYHQFNWHEFEQALGVGDGQGSLVCCSPWGLKESDMTERLNWTEHNTCWWIGYSRREKWCQWGLWDFILSNCENGVAIDCNECDGKWSRSGGYLEASGIIFHADYVSNVSIYIRQAALYRQLNMSIAL